MKKNAIIHIVILRRINSNYERLFEKYNISFEVYNCKMNNDYDLVKRLYSHDKEYEETLRVYSSDSILYKKDKQI